MVHGILIVLVAAVAQAAKTEAKPAVEVPEASSVDVKLTDAPRLLRNGRYAEAEEALTAIETEAKKAAGRVTLPQSLCIWPKRRAKPARANMSRRSRRSKRSRPEIREMPACRRSLPTCFSCCGDWPKPPRRPLAGRETRPNHLLAHWVSARLLELRGELEKSVVAWKWFVDRYNEKRPEIVKIGRVAGFGRAGRRAILSGQRARPGIERRS